MTKETRERLLSLWERVPETRPEFTDHGLTLHCEWYMDSWQRVSQIGQAISGLFDTEAEALATAKLVEWLADADELELSRCGGTWTACLSGCDDYAAPTLLEALLSAAEGAT